MDASKIDMVRKICRYRYIWIYMYKHSQVHNNKWIYIKINVVMYIINFYCNCISHLLTELIEN